ENIMQYSFRIAMFGRIEHGKGQHLLVEAINVLVKDNVDVGVTVVGHSMDDSYYASLKVDIAHYGLEDRFEFIPFIDRPMRVMPCFDVVVLLTYCETFGLVLVEAMRAGVAVIGTDAGGVPEIIKNNDTGLLVPPGNVAALVEALRKLVNNERFKNELAINGKKWADRKFNEEQHFNKLEVILESQLSQK
ncbi:MAG: glycosyltransferase family 4 protein, partial [Gammaproteobacteria bacterium]|nr:glycosyltransferase family 4 protein [Gammaproteobacteria bacterium]